MLKEKLFIIRFNRGEKDVLRDIYSLYKHELVSLACALLHDKTTAEDAVHDVFAKLISQQKTLNITRSLKRYLISAVANTARQYYRHQQKKSEVALDGVDCCSIRMGHPPESSMIFSEQQQQLSGAILQLPYEQREVILLRHFSDFKFKTIASLQNVSLNTVQGRYRYGLEKLRSLLNGALL